MNNHEVAIQGLEATIKEQQQAQVMLKHNFGVKLNDLTVQLQHYGDYAETNIVEDIEQRLNCLKQLASEITTASNSISNYEAAVASIKANV